MVGKRNKAVYLLILLVFRAMKVTVIPVFDYETQAAQPLKRVMAERLKRLAHELETIHLKTIAHIEPINADVVIYLSYNSKYTIRWQVVNDVPQDIDQKVREICLSLHYLPWKINTTSILALQSRREF